jgi:hypothetical protein
MATAQVQAIARHVLQANEAIALESPFKLGPMDHLVFLFVSIEAVFVYRRPSADFHDELIPLERLHQALSRLLDYYPHLSGRLQFHPVDRTPEITRMGTGAELLEAQCSIQLDEIARTSEDQMPYRLKRGRRLSNSNPRGFIQREPA